MMATAGAAGLRREDPGRADEHVAGVRAAIHAEPVDRPSAVPERLAPHRAQIAEWLAEDLRLTKIHRRLRVQGVDVPYRSLHRFAQTHLGLGAPAVTVRVAEPPPGEAAEVDFGLLGLWPDPATQRRRRVYGLLVTLCSSRYAFLAIALRQDLTAVLDGLEAAWTFLAVSYVVLSPTISRPSSPGPIGKCSARAARCTAAHRTPSASLARPATR